MRTEWDKAYIARQRSYPLSTAQGTRSPYTPPDKTENMLTLAMRFCIGVAAVCVIGFFTRR